LPLSCKAYLFLFLRDKLQSQLFRSISRIHQIYLLQSMLSPGSNRNNHDKL
jgi:hypothetical protein